MRIFFEQYRSHLAAYFGRGKGKALIRPLCFNFKGFYVFHYTFKIFGRTGKYVLCRFFTNTGAAEARYAENLAHAGQGFFKIVVLALGLDINC